MIKYVEEDLEGVVAIKIVDTINRDDYHTLIPELKKKIEQCGKVNLYLEIRDGVDWDEKSFWSNVNFDLKHAQDIRKAAFVGDEQMEEKIINLLRPLANAEIRWYTFSEKEEALKWIKA